MSPLDINDRVRFPQRVLESGGGIEARELAAAELRALRRDLLAEARQREPRFRDVQEVGSRVVRRVHA